MPGMRDYDPGKVLKYFSLLGKRGDGFSVFYKLKISYQKVHFQKE
jgi:hypothetical protein